MLIEKYSFGTGDRFGKEGLAQLRAVMEMNRLGIPIVPVWNKSNREHSIIGSLPVDVKNEAIQAVNTAGYLGSYYIDADHINMDTVDKFVAASNFFTIDVAHFIGMQSEPGAVADFKERYSKYIGNVTVPGITRPFYVTGEFLEKLGSNYLVALDEVRKIYERICHLKGPDHFIAEVSADEAELVQGPMELFFILAELKHLGVKVQTIAPKFSGLFAKGVDYIGDTSLFASEFEQDVAVVKYAVKELGMSKNLKLSVHSGSDKFSVYPFIKKAIRKFDAGIHVKTAGTTWLEEVTGLAESGNSGLEIAKEIYAASVERYDELTSPYATVLHVDKSKLPSVAEVEGWDGFRFTEAITHEKRCANYNPDFRQLIHVGYKVAAEMGERFLKALDENRDIVGERVKNNILEKHLKPLFL